MVLGFSREEMEERVQDVIDFKKIFSYPEYSGLKPEPNSSNAEIRFRVKT